MSANDPNIADPARSLAACLSPDLPVPEGSAPWLQAWLAAGIEPPSFDPRPGAPPHPGPEIRRDLRLVDRIHPQDLKDAAAWIASAVTSEEARGAALDLLTDCLAVGAAPPVPGFLTPAMGDAILGPPNGEAAPTPHACLWRPVGGRRRTDLVRAVFWNRFCGDPLELHVGPECVSAAVGAAEAFGRSLGELLDAIAIGCGIGAWHRDLIGGAMERTGVHSPGALASIAAAAVVSRLLGHDPGRTERALRLADARTPMHPYRAFADGAPVKFAYGAWGQALGLEAALEASSSGAGDEPAAGTTPARGFPDAAASGAVLRVGFKKYPGSRAVQPALAALETMPRFDPAEVTDLEILSYPFSTVVSSWAHPPARPIARQMHIPTAAALFLEARFRGEAFGAVDYAGELAPDTAALARRIELRSHEFGRPDDPPGTRVRKARVRVRTQRGAEAEAESDTPWAPPPPGALRERFGEFARGSALREPWRIPEDGAAGRLFDGDSTG